jgi:putative heme-binding domain-containing protein
MPDVLRTTTDSFRPIDVRLGPDGALYVADWSNPIIQHGEVDFRDPRRDKVHGRIWRIAAKARPLLPVVDFTTLTNAELLARLTSPNGYDQERATRVLVERGAAQVQADLTAWTASLAPQDAAARLRSLWLHQAFGAVPAALAESLLSSRDVDARAAAVRALGGEVPLTRLAVLVEDAHPRVRLEAVRALGRHPSAEAAALALGVLARPMDPFIDYALWLTINELAGPWVAAVQSGAWSPDGREIQLEFALKSIEPSLASTILGGILAQRGLPRDGSGPWIDLVAAAGGPAELRRLLDAVTVGSLDPAAVPRALRALADAARLRKVRPEGPADDMLAVLASTSGAARAAAFQVVGAWQFAPALPTLVQAASDPASGAVERQAAFAALREVGGAAAIAAARDLSANGATGEIRRDAVVVLAALDLARSVPDLIRVLRETGDETQAQALWRDLLAVRAVGGRLAEALQAETLPPLVAQAGLRPAREGNRHAALVPVLLQQAGLSLSAAELSPEELRQLAREAVLKGDAARGERIYRRTELACVACHAIGGAGGRLGPDLTSIGASAPPDYLVEAMLYPNAKIKEGYHAVAITTRSGSELSGMVVAESATEIRLRDAANQEVSVAVNDIARRTSVGSLMPAGLLDGLVPEERLDLIKFLTQLGKPGDFDAARGGVARSWRMYFVTSRNQQLGVGRVTQGDATLEDWQPLVALVNGILPGDEIARSVPGNGRYRPQFAAVDFEAPRAGEVTFALEGRVTGIWVNGEPVAVASRVTVPVAAGRHVLVVQLDEREPADLRVTSPEVTFLSP